MIFGGKFNSKVKKTVFYAVFTYQIGLQANGYVREQLLN